MRHSTTDTYQLKREVLNFRQDDTIRKLKKFR